MKDVILIFYEDLSFISLMKDILTWFLLDFVLHPPHERHFDSAPSGFCPSSPL